MKQKRNHIIKEIILKHVSNNSKEYILITIIFIIGIFLGVMFINNSQESQLSEITNYFNNFVEKMKNTEKLDNMAIFKTTIKENIILAITLWFFGTTVIGIPIVFGIVLYRGFCLGYTISTIITVFGFPKGMGFIISSLVLQNIILIPALIAISVSGFKLYKSIVKNRERENIKVEILRHTIFSLIMLFLLCIAALIETFISTNILKNFIKYF
ncbi:MAG: stage II sporulation protein M [Clostridia bacterium]